MRFFYKDSTSSTMDDAAQAIRAGISWPLCIVAQQQTAGRGRRGRSWSSPYGNIYTSMIWPWPLRYAYQAPFAVGIAVMRALKTCHIVHDQIALKWPNDIIVVAPKTDTASSGFPFQKLGGILIEALYAPDNRTELLNIGIGLNTHHAPPPATYPTTSLKNLGFACDPTQFLNALITELSTLLPQPTPHDMQRHQSDIYDAWMRLCGHLNKSITLRSDRIESQGLFKGLSHQGHAVIADTEGHIKNFSTGDIMLSG